MKLDRDARSHLNVIIDDAVSDADGDLTDAVRLVSHDLNSLEGGGIPWAGDVLGSATESGLRAMVRRRVKASRVVVDGTPMPMTYSGPTGLASWLEVPAADLDEMIKRIEKQGDTMTVRSGIMRLGQMLALRHGVSTAAQAFELEGIVVAVAS